MKTFESCRIEPKMISFLLRSLIILLSGIILPLPTLSYAGIQESIVKVFTTATVYNYDVPWQNNGTENFTGSGCIISDKRILTNAHVVSNATFIEVKRHGNPKRFIARVIAVSHDADLALLQVEENTFFDDTTPLKFGRLPELLDDVLVYGFPEGGEGLSVTKGIISRIEITRYVHSYLPLLGLQIDAAINSGNSGGPVIKDGKIIGIAMQTKTNAENIGYIIPVPIIEHFLTDIKDGHYDGFPDDGVVSQSLRNPTLKKSLKIPDSETGIYISYVIPGTSADGILFPGDVILNVDNHPVANDGTVLLRPGLRVQSKYYILYHQMGESAVITVLRNGSKLDITIPLTTKEGDSRLVKFPQYDCLPEYYILAGIIFTPLTFNYLTTWGDDIKEAPWDLMKYFLKFRDKADEQIVIIQGLLSSKMTAGYQGAENKRIISINGQRFTNFKSFTTMIDNALSSNNFITLKTDSHNIIVVSPQEHKKNEKRLLELYEINEPFKIEK